MKPIFVLNGPNLGRLGKRQPEIYGETTHEELADALVEIGESIGCEVSVRQTDSEADMLEWLHEAADASIPVILNPGAWTHYSIAIADAVAQIETVIEVHISNIHAREEFRRNSVISPYATGTIAGLGLAGYTLAMQWVAADS
ncbi:MAG: type II 3-dehydroquinate dehydratase [Propionibacteriales bacterium]|nr:MAG: type II 3-dehydroquinate dehydratase [Propionibacteriales bacterium]